MMCEYDESDRKPWMAMKRVLVKITSSSSVLWNQKIVTAYLKSKQLVPFSFARQTRDLGYHHYIMLSTMY